MTTTVLRGKTGALLRIPTGAVRRTPIVEGEAASDFAAFFIDESFGGYWDSGSQGDNWLRWKEDSARYAAALDVLQQQDPVVVAITALIAVAPLNFIFPLLPDGESYPPGVLPPGATEPPVLAREPSLQQIKDVFLPFQGAPNEELNPTHWVIDVSTSMVRNTLEPGRTEYIESVLEPGTYTERLSLDERWLRWAAIYLEGLAE